MTDTRTATCSCGQLRVTVPGGPVRAGVCHCLACQKRTGSVFSVQARWPQDQVTIEGASHVWRRIGDEEGGVMDFRFCPTCGATVWWTQEGEPFVAVAVGAFADPTFPAPVRSIYEARRHPWVELTEGIERRR
jgi:hypothetical protein